VLVTPEELAAAGAAAAAFETLPLKGAHSKTAAGEVLRYRVQAGDRILTVCCRFQMFVCFSFGALPHAAAPTLCALFQIDQRNSASM
jgi:hypothetical protein